MSSKELPVFKDSMRASSSWVDKLNLEIDTWNRLILTDPSIFESRIQPIQQEQISLRSNIDSGNLNKAITRIYSHALKTGNDLSVNDVICLNNDLTGKIDSGDIQESLRTSEPAKLSETHDPVPAVLLPQMLYDAFDWFTTEGFKELRPIEQSALVYLRLLDLHPFAAYTDETSQLVASYYTLRVGLPPLIIYADDETVSDYLNAMNAAFRFLTQPLVEFFAETMTKTIRSC